MKRARKKAVLARPQYFDTLPPEVIHTIQRHFSYVPHSDNWTMSVTLCDTVAALQLGNGLGFKNCVGLDIGMSKCEYTGFENDYHRHGNGLVRCESENIMLINKLMRALAARMQFFVFRFSDKTSYRWHSNCRQLRVLVIVNPIDEDSRSGSLRREPPSLEKLFKACGASLHELYLDLNEQLVTNVPFITKYCHALEILDVKEVWDAQPFESMLRAVGGTLKSLRFEYTEDPVHQLTPKVIVESCPKLEEISMPCVTVVPVAHTLQNRLKVVHITESNRRTYNMCSLRFLVTNCPNVIVNAPYSLYSTMDANMTYLLGKHLRTLSIQCRSYERIIDFDPIATKRLGVAFGSLSNLEQLQVETVSKKSQELLKLFFAKPKPKLQRLGLWSMESWGKGQPNALKIIGEAVTTLTRFEYSSWHVLRGEDCAAILRGNKNLKSINVFNFNDDPWNTAETKSNTVTLVSALKECPSLVDVRMNHSGKSEWSREIATACVPLRNRQLHFSIGEVVYLPVNSKVWNEAN